LQRGYLVRADGACKKKTYMLLFTFALKNPEGYVLIGVYLFIYLYACYSQNSKSIEPNRMKFGGMIGYYNPGTS